MIPHGFITHKATWRHALVRLIELETDPSATSFWQHELRAYDFAHSELEKDIWNVYVGDMKTSAGMDYYVVIESMQESDKNFFEKKRLTPYMFKERWKAEYEVALWDAFLNGKEEPDILAFNP